MSDEPGEDAAENDGEDDWEKPIKRQVDFIVAVRREYASLPLFNVPDTPGWRAMQQLQAVAHAMLDARMADDEEDALILLAESQLLVLDLLQFPDQGSST